MSNESNKLIRSYGRIAGRKLSQNKLNIIEDLTPLLSLDEIEENSTKLDPQKFFNNNNQIALEIGFGYGEHLIHQARLDQNTNFIGCETHINGIAALLGEIHKTPILKNNIRFHTQDARNLIKKLKNHSLDQCYILFPDPWPKAKHHKRRLINQDFLKLLSNKLKQGAQLLIATDHPSYLESLAPTILKSKQFTWNATSKKDWQNPPKTWIKTRYNQKADREGRQAHFLTLTTSPQ